MSSREDKHPLVYLDHSATTPVDPDVAEIVKDTMINSWGNPSSKYKKGNDAKLILENAREQVANLLNANPKDIFFTSGGTEADNMAIMGVMAAAKKNNKGNHLIVSSIEHSAVLKTAEVLKAEGFDVTILPVNSNGFIEPETLKEAIKDETVLVSVMHINNEIGTIQPIEEMAKICNEKNVLFHVDAVQSFGKYAIDVKKMGLDLVSVSSHKIYGPKGVGALYVRLGINIEPRARGGGQEKGLRTGTENMPGIVGFGAAAELCSKEMNEDHVRIGELRNSFYNWIKEAVDGKIILNGSAENRFYANLNLQFPDVEAESVLLSLDLDNIAVSTGSACSTGTTKPSHVLTAIGLSEVEAHSSLRLTLGRSNSEDDLRYAAERIGFHVRRLRDMASW